MFDSIALLFAPQARYSTLECRCGAGGYCPRCGDYQPSVTDPEIVELLNEQRRSSGGLRVVRKRLED